MSSPLRTGRHHRRWIAIGTRVPMTMTSARRRQRLGTLVVIGAVLLALGVAKASMAFDDISHYLPYRVVFTVCSLLAMLAVVALCQRLWRSHASAWHIASSVAAVALTLGMATSLGAQLAQVMFGNDRYMRTLALVQVFNGAYFSWFMLAATSALYFGFKQYEALQLERHHLFAANALAREAELRALRYQLQPHFLFNTLNAISTLVRDGDSRAATRMITRLADFLRATLEGSGAHEVTLDEEITLTRHYLEIEQVRFGARLAIEMQIDADVLPLLVPNMLLQPLVENAIRHGIAPSTQGGKITIRAYRRHDALCICVIDNGLGYAQRDATQSADGKVGIGLENTRARLDRLYPQRYRLEISRPATGGCSVSIELPCDAYLAANHEAPRIENT